MSDAIWLGIIAAVQGVTVAALALLGVLMQSTRKHARASAGSSRDALHQVQNDHSTNLRDDLDNFLKTILRRLDTHGRNLRGIRAELRTERRRTDRIEAQLGLDDPLKKGTHR